MFRKLRSNRDPANTLGSELRKEFAIYFSKAETGVKTLTQQYPKQIYAGMLVLIVVSLVFSFTTTKKIELQQSKPAIGTLKPVQDSFSDIMETGNTFRRTLMLKQEIEIIIGKDKLTAADSLRLEKALDELHDINKTLEK